MSGEQERFEKVREENRKLKMDIVELCKRPDRTKPEVVLLLGKSGSGKSSMINTICRVISGKSFQRAVTGRGAAGSKTLTLQRFEQCGLKDFELTEENRDLFEHVLHMFPTLYDAAGREYMDMESDNCKEIIELLIGGYIPKGTSVQFLEDKQREHGPGYLKVYFPESREERKITKVVLVLDWQSSFPEALAKYIMDIGSK